MRLGCCLWIAGCLAGCATDRLALTPPVAQNADGEPDDSAELSGQELTRKDAVAQRLESLHGGAPKLGASAAPSDRTAPPKLPWLYKALNWDDGTQPRTEEAIEFDYKFRNNG
jgi:hypothetical protein